MAGKIMVDTSILIDYYRKTDKSNSVWIGLVRAGYKFTVSAVTKYEIYSGATSHQRAFWDDVFKLIEVVALDDTCVHVAVELNSDLKRKRKQLDIADLFIAATALSNGLALATLNRKHFERIEKLNIIS